VRAALPLGKEGQVVVPGNAVGEIVKVVRNAAGGVAYQVHFECLLGRVLQVPEVALLPLAPQAAAAQAA
jgi:nitrogen fixation protein NifZ